MPETADVGALAAFGVEQTQKLEDANGRTRSILFIAETVDKKNEEIRKALKPRPWWKIF